MKNISEIIPKFIVSLQSNRERVDYINKYVIPKINNSIVIKAIDYNNDDLNQFLSINNIKISTNFYETGRIGQLACFLSHYQIWKHILQKKIDVAIILEDDVKLYKNFNTIIDKIYENLPTNFDYVHLFIHPDKQKVEYLESPDGDITSAEDNFGTVAYLISLKGAKRLYKLTKLLKIQAPVDRQINFYISHNFINAFMVKKPFLITQGEIMPNRGLYPNSYKSTIWNSALIKNINISETNITEAGFNEKDNIVLEEDKKEEIIIEKPQINEEEEDERIIKNIVEKLKDNFDEELK